MNSNDQISDAEWEAWLDSATEVPLPFSYLTPEELRQYEEYRLRVARRAEEAEEEAAAREHGMTVERYRAYCAQCVRDREEVSLRREAERRGMTVEEYREARQREDDELEDMTVNV